MLCYCIFSLASASSAAEDIPAKLSSKNNYFKIKLGIVQPTSLDGNSGLGAGKVTYTTGIAIGRKFHDLISTDIEYMYRAKSTAQNSVPGQESSTPTSWAAESNTVMLNLTLDLLANSTTTPYLKAGAGFSINKAATYVLSEENAVEPYDFAGKTTKNFAWQVGCGVSISSTSMFSTELEYMFVNRGTIISEAFYTTKSDRNNKSYPARKGDFLDHIVTVGLKVKF